MGTENFFLKNWWKEWKWNRPVQYLSVFKSVGFLNTVGYFRQCIMEHMWYSNLCMTMFLWRNRLIDVTAYIIFQRVYFMKASSTAEFCSWRNRKLVVCSVNADFGRNVNIAKLACVIDYSLNCSDLYRPIEIVSTAAAPWRLIVYRNKKRTGTFFTQKVFLLHFVFLGNFYLEGTGSNEQKHFCSKFLLEKRHIHQSCSQRFLFFWQRTAARNVSKGKNLWERD